MARAKATWLGSRRLLVVVAAAMLVHGLISPRAADPWTRLLRAPLEVLVQPLQSLLGRMLSVVRRPAVTPVSDDPRVANLQEQLEIWKVYFQQKSDEVARWKRQVEDLQKGLSVSPDVPVTQIPAPVVGGGTDHSSSVLKVRAGRRVGITPYNAVAVVEGVQLVGRVVAAAAPFLEVVPITDRRAPTIGGVIMLDDLNRGPRCALRAAGDGTLRGDVIFPDDDAVNRPEVRPGMTVRLFDEAWPQPAQGLVIGTVERIEPKPTQALRPVVTVRPTVRIDRVTAVVLRIVGDVADELAGGTP
jgi:cell shape-determining protein MreC